mgnify:CR=1 FL=1
MIEKAKKSKFNKFNKGNKTTKQQNNKTTKQQNNKTTTQQNNKTTKQQPDNTNKARRKKQNTAQSMSWESIIVFISTFLLSSSLCCASYVCHLFVSWFTGGRVGERRGQERSPEPRSRVFTERGDSGLQIEGSAADAYLSVLQSKANVEVIRSVNTALVDAGVIWLASGIMKTNIFFAAFFFFHHIHEGGGDRTPSIDREVVHLFGGMEGEALQAR